MKNPHKVEEVDERTPEEIHESLAALHAKAGTLLAEIETIIEEDEA